MLRLLPFLLKHASCTTIIDSLLFLYFLFSNYKTIQVRVYGYEAKYSFHLWDTIAFFDSLDLFIKDKPSLSDLRFRDHIQDIVMKFVTGTHEEENNNKEGNEQHEDPHEVSFSPQSKQSLEEPDKNQEKKLEKTRNDNSFLWKAVPVEVALIGSLNTSLVSSFRDDQCSFWLQQGLLDYVWVS